MAANPALVRLLGYGSRGRAARSCASSATSTCIPKSATTGCATWRTRARSATPSWCCKRKDGRKIVVLENSRAVRDEQGQVIYYEGTLTDITEAHELSRQLSYEASHDALSGLINRREFEMRLQRALDSCRRGSTHAVCYLDLDQFKIINDTCGHIAGDELLRQLAQVLQGRVRSNDTLARLGGDEFGLLLHDCPVDDAVHGCERLAQGRRAASVRVGQQHVHRWARASAWCR